MMITRPYSILRLWLWNFQKDKPPSDRDIVFFSLYCRVGFFINDNLTVANALANAAD